MQLDQVRYEPFPGDLRLKVCSVCHGVVPQTYMTRHASWHVDREEASPPPSPPDMMRRMGCDLYRQFYNDSALFASLDGAERVTLSSDSYRSLGRPDKISITVVPHS